MDDQFKVCLLNDSFPPAIDGVANCVFNYANIIENKYGSAVVAVPHYPNVEDNYPYDVIRYPSIDTTKICGYRTGIPYWPTSIHELLKYNFDIIHTHCPFVSTLIARSLRMTLNVPIVLTYHSKFDIDIKKAVELGFLQAAAIRFIVNNIEACDEVWVVSEGAGDNLKSLGYKGEYRVMENGVDFPRGRAEEEDIEKLSREYDLSSDVPVFLCVGRMMWYKGIRIILDGLHEVKAKGARFKMIFVGDGADLDEIKQLADMLKLTEDCIFTGAVYDRKKLRAFFSRADMFLFPSTYDTNGLVVREAAACGLASILVRGSCAAEGVTDGRNGILIEENSASLAAAVQKLLNDHEDLKKMGQTAMDEVYVSWEDAVGKAYERYPEVVNNYRQSNGESVDIQDKKLFKLAGDVEKAFEKLKKYREWQKRVVRQKRNKQSDCSNTGASAGKQ